MDANLGMHQTSPNADSGEWSGQDYPATNYGNDSQIDVKSSPGMGLDFFKQFGGAQKKVTRDGQPAKRRGPKPDSKPAQTRRQELNRQAQRTHRERKEQYIKALEVELARLRETYARDTNIFNSSLEQLKMAFQEQRQENDVLRHILANHGVPFETELANHKSQIGIASHRTPPAHQSPLPPRHTYQSVVSAPPSSTGYTNVESGYGNGRATSVSGTSQGGATHHSHSPAGPDVMEQSIKQEPGTVMSMPGIFEKDPQLGIDFILALEATCRDHNEYLVRRSMDSPNDLENAQISGHALMASVPPPSHISATPAQSGGLIPTYPLQVPDMPLQSLNNLLNLAKASNQLQANGFFEGGQVTPVMALQSLRGHPHYNTLTRVDIEAMIESVKNKVRCYGFGAVMEDFELRDAVSSIFARHPETYETAFGNEDIVATDDMYS